MRTLCAEMIGLVISMSPNQIRMKILTWTRRTRFQQKKRMRKKSTKQVVLQGNEDLPGMVGPHQNVGDWRYVGTMSSTDPVASIQHSSYLQRPKRVSREERDRHAARLEKHYMSGTWYGQSASGTIYILATVLERVDNDLLWYVHLPFYLFKSQTQPIPSVHH